MVSPATAGAGQMHAIMQRIARHKNARQPMRQRVDDRDFEAEAPIVDQDWKVVAFAQQSLGVPGKPVQTNQQRRRRLRRVERFDIRARGSERILRNIDPVEIAVILLAVLQVIDDLQRGAQRVVGRPAIAAFAVDVADETADRHGRQRAISDQIVPIAIAQFCDVELERGEQILRMLRREIMRGELGAQPHRDRVAVVLAGQPGIEAIEQLEFFGRRQRRVVGDVVRRAHEIVERQDRPAMAPSNEPGRHREILIPVALARSQCARIIHRSSETLDSETLAWARPFHMPPRPRAC